MMLFPQGLSMNTPRIELLLPSNHPAVEKDMKNRLQRRRALSSKYLGKLFGVDEV